VVVVSLQSAKYSRRDQDRRTDDLPNATRLIGWLPAEANRTRMESVMKSHILAAAALVAVAAPARAQGIDSKHSPYSASAYAGYVGNAREVLLPEISVTTHYRVAPAYRYSGHHAGGPADALAR
jgi:hypothetical protein